MTTNLPSAVARPRLIIVDDNPDAGISLNVDHVAGLEPQGVAGESLPALYDVVRINPDNSRTVVLSDLS